MALYPFPTPYDSSDDKDKESKKMKDARSKLDFSDIGEKVEEKKEPIKSVQEKRRDKLKKRSERDGMRTERKKRLEKRSERQDKKFQNKSTRAIERGDIGEQSEFGAYQTNKRTRLKQMLANATATLGSGDAKLQKVDAKYGSDGYEAQERARQNLNNVLGDITSTNTLEKSNTFDDVAQTSVDALDLKYDDGTSGLISEDSSPATFMRKEYLKNKGY